jgi:hypothetical protein
MCFYGYQNKETATAYLCTIHCLFFFTTEESVYCAVRAETLNANQFSLRL